MLPESTHVTDHHVKALIGKDIAARFPNAPPDWLRYSTELNYKRIACLHLGQCNGMGIKTSKGRCCVKKRKCFSSCKA